MVHEDVISGLAADKSVTFFVVKPLNCALFFHFFLFTFLVLRWQVDLLSCLALLRGSNRETPIHSESAEALEAGQTPDRIGETIRLSEE
jgi:hypothetical protein